MSGTVKVRKATFGSREGWPNTAGSHHSAARRPPTRSLLRSSTAACCRSAAVKRSSLRRRKHSPSIYIHITTFVETSALLSQACCCWHEWQRCAPTRSNIGSIYDRRGACQLCLHWVNIRDTLEALFIHKSVAEREREEKSSGGLLGCFYFPLIVCCVDSFVSRTLVFKRRPVSVRARKRKLRHTQNPHARSHVKAAACGGWGWGVGFRCFVWSAEMKAQSTK